MSIYGYNWEREMKEDIKENQEKIRLQESRMFKIGEAYGSLVASVPIFAKRVEPIYKLLDWHWGLGGEKNVPDREDIAKSCFEAIESSIKELKENPSTDCIKSEIGGIAVEIDLQNEDEVAILYLKIEKE